MTLNDNVIFVEGGSFKMGFKKGDKDERPVHNVKISNFAMGKYEITQSEYKDLIKNNPSKFIEEQKPVERVTWFDAIIYCNELSRKEGFAIAYDKEGNLLDEFGKITEDITKVEGYRLPTEADWEFAARGGNKTKGYKYSGSDIIDDVAWHSGNSKNKTQLVGTKNANELGLYDMTGNVSEWCQDWYDEGSYTNDKNVNPYISKKSSTRVKRGSDWSQFNFNSRISYRTSYNPSRFNAIIGFRVCRSIF